MNRAARIARASSWRLIVGSLLVLASTVLLAGTLPLESLVKRFHFVPAAPASHCTILLHGLVRSPQSLDKLAYALQAEDHAVVQVGYPSRQAEIDQLALVAVREGLVGCDEISPSAKINFVTHSMGGILLRVYLRDYQIEGFGRAVMLGPPNQGSRVVDVLKDVPGYDLVNGPAGRQLGTDRNSVPKQLGAVDFPLGIIAGSRSINPILSTMLADPDDGKVSAENTKVEGMTDHLLVAASHALMMNNERVIAQTIHFLEIGQFVQSSAPATSR